MPVRYGRPAGITSLRYGTTVGVGLMKRGRYWRCGCWIKATHGPQVVLELGLDKQPGAGNQIRLVDLDEEDRQLLMAEALEQVKREYWLGMTTGTTAAPTEAEAEAAKPTYPAASTPAVCGNPILCWPKARPGRGRIHRRCPVCHRIRIGRCCCRPTDFSLCCMPNSHTSRRAPGTGRGMRPARTAPLGRWSAVDGRAPGQRLSEYPACAEPTVSCTRCSRLPASPDPFR